MISTAMLKVGLSLTALFVFGGVCGFAVATRRMANPTVRSQMEERWIEARRREDARRLKLTPGQVEQVRPMYQQMAADVRTVREAAARGLIEAGLKQAQSLKLQLTPEQQQEFQRLTEERRQQLQKRSSSS